MKLINLFAIGTVILSLSACTLTKVTDKHQICEQAKRQAIYNATSPSSLNSDSIKTSMQKNNTDMATANCG